MTRQRITYAVTFLQRNLCNPELVLASNARFVCSFDNAETYESGKAEEVMGQAFKVRTLGVLGK